MWFVLVPYSTVYLWTIPGVTPLPRYPRSKLCHYTRFTVLTTGFHVFTTFLIRPQTEPSAIRIIRDCDKNGALSKIYPDEAVLSGLYRNYVNPY